MEIICCFPTQTAIFFLAAIYSPPASALPARELPIIYARGRESVRGENTNGDDMSTARPERMARKHGINRNRFYESGREWLRDSTIRGRR
jgi:hypothetical protein